MKTIAKISIVLACLALLLAGGYLLTSKLSVKSEITIVPASAESEKFEKIKSEIASGAYEGVGELGDISNYCFVTIRLDIRSFSPFKTEWISLSADYMPGDVLTVSSNAWLKEMRAFGKLEGEDAMYIELLSSSRDINRGYKLEYYIFGRYHDISDTVA